MEEEKRKLFKEAAERRSKISALEARYENVVQVNGQMQLLLLLTWVMFRFTMRTQIHTTLHRVASAEVDVGSRGCCLQVSTKPIEEVCKMFLFGRTLRAARRKTAQDIPRLTMSFVSGRYL